MDENLNIEQASQQTAEDAFNEASKTVCGTMIVYNVLSILVAIVVSALVYAIANTKLSSTEEIGFETFLINIIVTVFITWIILRYHKKHNDMHLPLCTLKKTDIKPIIQYTILGLGLSMIGSLLVTILTLALNQVSLDLTTPDFDLKTTLLFNITLLTNTLIIAPIFEELLYRGLVMHYLERFGKITACLITSFIFASMHGNFIQAIPVFFLSMAICALRLKTGSLIAVIIMHFINNLIATLASYFIDTTFLYLIVAIEWGCLLYAIYFISKNMQKIREELHGMTSMMRKFFFGNWKAILFSIFSLFTLIASIAIL